MTHAILNQSLFLISVLMVALGIVIPLVGNWISNRRNYQGKASMEDIYDRWSYSNQQETAAADKDEAYRWLEEHEKVCPQTTIGLTREDGVPMIHRICPTCADAQHLMWGIQPIRTPEMVLPDFVDPRTEAKQVFANIHTLHPERAA
jgi:hypothetical protein